MRFLRTLLVLALLGAAITGTHRLIPRSSADTPAVTPVVAPSGNLGAALATLLNSEVLPGNPTADERRLVDGFYEAGAIAPVWIDDAGTLTGPGRQAVDLLAGADSHGLDPDDYRVDADPVDPASFEVALTLSMLRYLGDISVGRINPATLGFDLPAGLDRAALPALLRENADAGRTTAAVNAAMPTVGNYEGLRHALARYRALAQHPEPQSLPTPGTSIRVGEPLEWAVALRVRLETFGDLESAPQSDEPIITEDSYSSSLEAGVKSFQRRHNLTDDGVLGKATIAALNVPLATRVRQLELSLERLRWLRRDLDGPVIVVNIPMFHLSAWDDVRAAAPVMTMKVVVGTQGRNATPVFASTVERVVFRPYWNVPRSIVVGEILPKALADPAYLAAHQYELVRGQSDRGAVVPVSVESLKELEAGTLRLRQRPGTSNALGLIKFDFRNDHAVYLHDTPTKSAFTRDGRALSHGCVRVEQPLALASWVLQTATENVQQATRGRDSQMVSVPRPVRVLLTYATAAVDADGTVRFAQDIYGHDTRLSRALQ